jgi:uncharacterized repeat protein (TIGR03803 family)
VAGQGPVNGVILDKQGNIYGSEPFDDFASGKSLIFKLTPSSGGGKWADSTLYRFYPSSKCYSSGPLAIDANGVLYGVFSAHGSAGSHCNDTSNENVFQLAPSASDPNVWVKTDMYTFTNSNLPRGYELTAPLTIDAGGNVYGTTLEGGTIGGGTAFMLKPRPGVAGKWNYTALFDFAPPSGKSPNPSITGSSPNGGLVLDSVGNLYGTTKAGGSGGRGTFFSLTP